jgi:O-antigen biosynthesis protein
LEQCLYSLRAALRDIPSEIWVVDNASTDGSIPFLKPLFPEVNWIENSQNKGFGKANNQALLKCRGDFILFLNPDTLVPEDGLKKSLEFMNSQPDAGAIGIRMIDGSGEYLPESKRSFPGPLTSFFKLIGLTALFPKSPLFAKYYLGHLSPRENHPIDVMAGAYMLVRKKVLEATGGFDEQFFMYGEDIDLSYRIKQTTNPATGGHWQNYYFAESSIIHFKGESTKKGSLNYVVMFYKAMVQFVRKHYATGRASIFIFFIYLAIAARASVSLFGRAVKKIGLPVIDALLVMASLLGVYFVWSYYVRPDVVWVPHLLRFALPVFTLIFLGIGALAGLYSRWYAPRRIITALCLAIVAVLAAYSLLPEGWRFSRGIVLFGGIISGSLIVLLRSILGRLGFMDAYTEIGIKDSIIVAGSESDFESIKEIYMRHHVADNILGRLSIGGKAEGALMPLDTWLQAPGLLPANQIIFSISNELPLSKVSLQLSPQKGISYKFYFRGSSSIVGSEGSEERGETLSGNVHYRLGEPPAISQKKITDVLVAMLLLCTFPVHLFFVKSFPGLIKNIFEVLRGKKTWIGYTGKGDGLPNLLPGVIAVNGLPHNLNSQLNNETRHLLDARYALDYYYWLDLSLIRKNYRMLGSQHPPLH